jgi:uncharacterized alpha-E superfamily protein
LSPDLPLDVPEQWLALVLTTGDEQRFRELYDDTSRKSVIEFLAFDDRYANSITSCIALARESARGIRDVIGSEMWESVNSFHHLVIGARTQMTTILAEPYEFFARVREASYQFNGVTNATFSHSESWHFLRLGRMLERADKTSRILDVKYFILLPSPRDVGSPIDDLQWAAMLRSVSGFEMYRQRFHQITPGRVVKFLMLDRQFPRAVLHCLDLALRSLHAIDETPADDFSNPAEQVLGRLRSELVYTSVDEIITIGLHQYIDQLQTRINNVVQAVHEQFFSLYPVR